jgi:hypothetical protein
MQNEKLKRQKERREACSLSSILHFTFLILHYPASSAFNLWLRPIANRYSVADENSFCRLLAISLALRCR